MDPSLDFKIISKHRRMINHYYPKLRLVLSSLNDSQLWMKDEDDLNSIGGIIIHIMEHIKRNTQRMITPDVLFKKGIENTFMDLNITRDALLNQLEKEMKEFELAINKAEVFCMYDIYHLIEHTGYHLGQVVDRVQKITGKRFQFVQNGINEKTLKEYINMKLNNH